MVRQITIVGSVIYCVIISFAFAGTFRDDFEDGNLDGWTVSNVGEWNVENGKLSGKFDAGAVASAIYLKPSSWRDYTLEASVSLVQRLGNPPEMAFCLRFDPPTGNTYGFCLHFVNNHAEIYRISGWNAGAIRNLLSVPYDFSENTWYRVKCSVSGKHLSFFIDDELCAEIDNADLVSGTAGVYICSVHVLIDDIVITGDEIPDVGQNVKPISKLAAAWGSIKRGR